MKKRTLYLSVFLFMGLVFLSGLNDAAQKSKVPEFDVLIKNGKVLDGSLKPAYKADVAAIFDHLRDSHLIELYKKTTPYYPLSERHLQYLDEMSRKSLSVWSAGDWSAPVLLEVSVLQKGEHCSYRN